MNNKYFKEIVSQFIDSKIKMESIIITKDNVTYKHFFKDEKLTDLRSITKMIMGLTLGIALSKGYFKDGLETYILPYFDNIKITNKDNLKYLKQLKIKHLITYTAGYDKQVLNKTFLADLNGKTNYTEIALNYPLKYIPGEKFVFSNAPIYLLSIIMEKELNIKLEHFIIENIFDKLDIKEYYFKINEEGYFWGATGLKLLPSDLHKIGLMLLNKGEYNNIQVVPNEFIKEMITLKKLASTDYHKSKVLPKYGHGYTMWLCENDIYYHDGKSGKYVICIPNKNMVITITANDEEHRQDILEILKSVIRD